MRLVFCFFLFSLWSGTSWASEKLSVILVTPDFVGLPDGHNVSVTSTAVGINCGLDCYESYPTNTTVRLTATSSSNYIFDEWRFNIGTIVVSDCITSSPSCGIVMAGDITVYAVFREASSSSSDYTITPNTIATGGGTWGSILKMDAFISGSRIILTIRKIDGGIFSEAGSITIHHGSYNSLDRLTGSTFGNFSEEIVTIIDLSKFPNSEFPIDFPYQLYAHITNSSGNAWVGPIQVEKTIGTNFLPTAPKISLLPTSIQQNEPVEIEIERGTDLDGSQVKVSCTATDSNYSPSADGSAYVSDFGLGGSKVNPSFIFYESGTKGIFCSSIDESGARSSESASRTITVTSSLEPVNGQCGEENGKTYPSDATNWESSDFCSVGEVSPSIPSFPNAGGDVDWSCQGENGGTSASCSANRTNNNVTINSIMPNKIRVNRTTNILINGVNLPEEINVSLDSISCKKFDSHPNIVNQPIYIFSCTPTSINNSPIIVTDNNGNIITNSSGENLSIDVVSEDQKEKEITILPLISKNIPSNEVFKIDDHFIKSKKYFENQFKKKGYKINIINSGYINETPFVNNVITSSGESYIDARGYMNKSTASYEVEKLRIENKADVTFVVTDSYLANTIRGTLSPIGGLVKPPVPNRVESINTYSVATITVNTKITKPEHTQNLILHELGHLLGLKHGHNGEDGNFYVNDYRETYGRGYCDSEKSRSTLMFYPQICRLKATWENNYSEFIGCDSSQKNCTHHSFGILEITIPEVASNYLN